MLADRSKKQESTTMHSTTAISPRHDSHTRPNDSDRDPDSVHTCRHYLLRGNRPANGGAARGRGKSQFSFSALATRFRARMRSPYSRPSVTLRYTELKRLRENCNLFRRGFDTRRQCQRSSRLTQR